MSGKPQDPARRFASKVGASTEDDCWWWNGYVNSKGYGRFHVSVEVGAVQAHRYAYEQNVGPIPAGLTLDHLCRNRRPPDWCGHDDAGWYLEIIAKREAEIARLTARIIRLDSGLRESAGARHAIGHAGQEITGDIIGFEDCMRAGCVSARAALAAPLDDIHGTQTFSD